MRQVVGFILILISAVVLHLGGSGSALAQGPPPATGDETTKPQPKPYPFVDEDGDGFNDLAPDRDGDGIPNRLDPDTRGQENSSEGLHPWFRFARLFNLLREAQFRQGAGDGPGLFGPGGLEDGPGPRTGSRPGSGGPSGDGVDMGGGTQRREGQR